LAEVRWQPGAIDHLREIYEYVSADKPEAARRLFEDIIELIDGLWEFPLSGRAVPEIGDPSVRELILGSYRIVYKLDGDFVYIVAIHHGARDLGPEQLRAGERN
jgi:toxin ParE1/3/4